MKVKEIEALNACEIAENETVNSRIVARAGFKIANAPGKSRRKKDKSESRHLWG